MIVKEKMFKYFSANSTRKCIDALIDEMELRVTNDSFPEGYTPRWTEEVFTFQKFSIQTYLRIR